MSQRPEAAPVKALIGHSVDTTDLEVELVLPVDQYTALVDLHVPGVRFNFANTPTRRRGLVSRPGVIVRLFVSCETSEPAIDKAHEINAVLDRLREVVYKTCGVEQKGGM